jgi:enoyl-CoA hydratase
VEHVLLDITDGIATVTLDRPPVNALDTTTFRDLTATFTDLAMSRDARVAILTATGDRAFCGGVDLGDSARRHSGTGDRPITDVLDPGRVARDCFWSIYECPLPVIAAVNAAAVGAGVALVASCDLVIASERARFAVTEINAGVLGGGRHLQRMVGPQFARRMFFTGEFVGAGEFWRRGAVESVVAPEELLPAARALAAVMATKSPLGLRLAKESLNRVEHLSLQDGYRLEQDYTIRMTRFADSAEARRAYLDKRDPEWTWT